MVLWCCKGGGSILSSVSEGLSGCCVVQNFEYCGAVIISITDLSPLSEEACLKKKSFLRW